MVNCHSRSIRDKGISLENEGETAEELSIERRRKWLAAISHDGLTKVILCNGRVCSRHFVTGKAAAAWDKFNIDWVPTLSLGHNKRPINEQESELQAARRELPKARGKRRHEIALLESSLN